MEEDTPIDLLQKSRNLLLIEGILFALLGFLAVAMPGISTLSTELFIGWLILFGGIFQAYRTFIARQAPGFWGSLLTSILYIIFGLLMVIFPVAGIISLTLLLIFFFALEGIAKIILGFQLKPFRRWGWFILNGVLALAMAVIIWAGWPGTAFWALGLLVGINMIFFGISLVFLALGIPKVKTGS
ncbi:HdeD family acid-resistance protein [Candidatus Protochlamydia phocaeensis]|uniref:HdeD family acid-resistance protein n=1 Tax=Candidatus Protochlamydia phocaeensis TaxID=1414722 RepID=UPI000837B211|nr:HdeD family acid-resistance protein [Candidatus Protochlamydia phocaeensis]